MSPTDRRVVGVVRVGGGRRVGELGDHVVDCARHPAVRERRATLSGVPQPGRAGIAEPVGQGAAAEGEGRGARRDAGAGVGLGGHGDRDHLPRGAGEDARERAARGGQGDGRHPRADVAVAQRDLHRRARSSPTRCPATRPASTPARPRRGSRRRGRRTSPGPPSGQRSVPRWAPQSGVVVPDSGENTTNTSTATATTSAATSATSTPRRPRAGGGGGSGGGGATAVGGRAGPGDQGIAVGTPDWRAGTGARTGTGRPASASRAAAARAPADGWRWAGSLAIPRATTSSRPGGTGARALGRGGGLNRCARITETAVSATKGRTPVSASCSTQARA